MRHYQNGAPSGSQLVAAPNAPQKTLKYPPPPPYPPTCSPIPVSSTAMRRHLTYIVSSTTRREMAANRRRFRDLRLLRSTAPQTQHTSWYLFTITGIIFFILYLTNSTTMSARTKSRQRMSDVFNGSFCPEFFSRIRHG